MDRTHTKHTRWADSEPVNAQRQLIKGMFGFCFVALVEGLAGGLLLCRVTPEGGTSVIDTTCSGAWTKLFVSSNSGSNLAATADGEKPSSGPGRSVNRSGAQAFGLTHPKVRRLTHQLPNAGYCDRYLGWEGERPELPPLVSCTKQRQAVTFMKVISSMLLYLSVGICRHSNTCELFRSAAPRIFTHLKGKGVPCLLHADTVQYALVPCPLPADVFQDGNDLQQIINHHTGYTSRNVEDCGWVRPGESGRAACPKARVSVEKALE